MVRIFCEVMSHSAINRSVDKVSALRGSIDTRESITNMPRIMPQTDPGDWHRPLTRTL